ncbi:recombinase [Clostridium sp. CAG:306]|nr:recombinase [Clostridium sp. CAG:306]
MKKAVLYARVSSNRQEKEGFSIPAQIKFLREYALRNNIEIVEEFVEAETAKKAGRAEFNRMVDYLQQHEDERIILVEKVDRLYRNLPDYGTIDNIKGLEIHFVKENEILSENSRSGIKFMIGIRVLMAKQYVDNLAEESAKGLNERIEQGYALYPPLGYMYGNDGTHKHAIIKDPERAEYAVRAFNLFVYENLSASSINNILYEEGLRNPDGNKYAVSTIQRMFRNVMYVGDYMYQGKLYPNGKHEALISRELFQLAQNKLNNSSDTTRQHDIEFPYIGLFKCGVCGCSYTAERKVKPSGKEYIYYHCTGKGKIKTCKKASYINESKIDKFIIEILKNLENLPQSLINEIKDSLKKIHDLKNEYSNTTQDNIYKRIQEVDRMIQNGYKRMLKSTNDSENELWNATYTELRAEKEHLMEKLSCIDKADDDFYKQSDLILKFCKNASKIFMKATPSEKRTICEIIGSNFTANAQNIDITLYPIFYDIIEMNRLGHSQNGRFELAQTQSCTKKEPLDKALNLNGGTDEARTRDLLRDRQAL